MQDDRDKRESATMYFSDIWEETCTRIVWVINELEKKT